jgi:hypothetical protein
MAKANHTWKVLPHGAVEEVTENLWRVEGELEGMEMRRVMTIGKRSDGDLVIHNAIALDNASMAKIEAWGKVGYLVVPNGYHRLDAPVFKQRYPQARVLCPRGGRAKVEDRLDFPPRDRIDGRPPRLADHEAVCHQGQGCISRSPCAAGRDRGPAPHDRVAP